MISRLKAVACVISVRRVIMDRTTPFQFRNREISESRPGDHGYRLARQLDGYENAFSGTGAFERLRAQVMRQRPPRR